MIKTCLWPTKKPYVVPTDEVLTDEMPEIKTYYWPTKIPYVVPTDEMPNDKDKLLYY